MICQVARDANDYAVGWLGRQPAVKEESITDWLLDYFQQHSTDIRYYLFDRHEEARISGADWDWWILLRSGCFKLRVQAKKVRRGKDHYSELARSNQTGYQIDLLLNSSAQLNFYPLYSLYGLTEGVERCKRTGRPVALSICSAQEVYDLVFGAARKRIESGDLLAMTIPLECLFCCPLVRDVRDRGPDELFRHYFRVPPRKPSDNDSADNHRGYEESTPSIIKNLYQMEASNDNTAGLLREYESMYRGSNGVVISRVKD